ncbi:hypothetical protein [Streptococcus sobrinus]|uniref:hypothetical protein n=2 Tax=Streptococcus sobrinus TaxID=1310 RepID=UPI0002F40735|nr:hypothetical protein [Streptococcus sobrinus]
MNWNKFELREMTVEEKDSFNTVNLIWETPVPDDGETVLVSDGQDIWLDAWGDYGSDGAALEEYAGDNEGLYWMSLPELPPQTDAAKQDGRGRQ